MKRIFIAFPAGPRTSRALECVQRSIRNIYPDALVRWTEKGNFHITLEFLGEIREEDVTAVERALELVVGNYPAFEYHLGGVRAFPDLLRPKVLVVRVRDLSGIDVRLREDIHKQLQSIRLADNGRKWKPHLTLGRIKKPFKMSALKKMVISGVSWRTEKVILYESRLTSQGPIYRSLREFELNSK